MEKVNILVADDHAMIREGIKHMLTEVGEIAYQEASHGLEAVEKYMRTKPDLVILDISMPRMNGLETISKILEFDPDARIIIHSMHDSDNYITKCLHDGVRGYVSKSESRGELAHAVRAVLRGDTYYSLEVKNNILKTLRKSAERKTDTSITPREIEIVKLIGEGLTSAQIADKLFISPRTVDTHRANLMKKLNARNTIDLLKKLKEDEATAARIW